MTDFEQTPPDQIEDVTRVYTAGALEYDQVGLTGEPMQVANLVYESYPENKMDQPMLGEEARRFWRERADVITCYVSGTTTPQPPLRSGDVWRRGDPDTGRYTGYEVEQVKREHADKVRPGERILTPRDRVANWGLEHLAETLEQRIGRTSLSIIIY